MLCSFCKQEIKRKLKPYMLKGKHTFCNHGCYSQFRSIYYIGKKGANYKGKIKKVCGYCKQEYFVYPYRAKRTRFCSLKCCAKANLKEYILSRKKPAPDIDYERTTENYRVWRDKVYRRDFWTCQIPDCGYKGNKISAHHIFKFQDYPDLRYVVSNGITLCKSCHAHIQACEEKMIPFFLALVESVTSIRGTSQDVLEMKMCSELHRNMQRQAEMTCPSTVSHRRR